MGHRTDQRKPGGREVRAPETRRPSAGPRRPPQHHITHSPNRTPPRRPRQSGEWTFAAYLGTALRHTRAAVDARLRHGVCHRAVAAVVRAREALDAALWLAEYIREDGDERG